MMKKIRCKPKLQSLQRNKHGKHQIPSGSPRPANSGWAITPEATHLKMNRPMLSTAYRRWTGRMKTSGKKIYQQDDITIIHIHYNKIAQPYQRLVRLGFLYAYASEIKNSYHHQLCWVELILKSCHKAAFA